MAFALSEHIRSLRKARGLTQEQLAEALGVTAGAVYKWESRLSLPELPMLVQLADFFDTSVDALIGYTIKDNRRDATLARLMDLRHAKNLRGVDEAERAVMRYPNCFAIVYQAAVMMQVFGLEQSDKALTARAGTLRAGAAADRAEHQFGNQRADDSRGNGRVRPDAGTKGKGAGNPQGQQPDGTE